MGPTDAPPVRPLERVRVAADEPAGLDSGSPEDGAADPLGLPVMDADRRAAGLRLADVQQLRREAIDRYFCNLQNLFATEV